VLSSWRRSALAPFTLVDSTLSAPSALVGVSLLGSRVLVIRVGLGKPIDMRLTMVVAATPCFGLRTPQGIGSGISGLGYMWQRTLSNIARATSHHADRTTPCATANFAIALPNKMMTME